MLKQLRNKKTAKKVWIILAILIVPAFVLWGSGSLTRSKQEQPFAGRIFGRKISLLEFKDSFEAVRIAAIMQFGDKISEMQKYLNLEQQAWERLILLEEAKIRKIHVSDKEVIGLIQKDPAFQRKGKFDNKQYLEILQYVFRTQPRIFEEMTRKNLILSKLFIQLTGNISVNEKEIKSEYQKFNEEISLYYIAGLPADFAKDISFSEQEVKDYFDKSQLNFKQPISFNLEYIATDSEDKIKGAMASLNKRADLFVIAKETGLAIKETGLFTQEAPIPGIGWSPEVFNLVSKLKEGELSGPLQIDKDIYILRLKERKESFIPGFENIKDRVKEAFIKAKSEEIAKARIEGALSKLKDLYKESPKLIDFSRTAKEFGLKSDSTNMFKFGSYIEGIGGSDALWLAAKNLKEDEFSGAIQMPSGYYIVKLKASTPIDEKKFESEKKDFSQKLLQRKKEEYVMKFFEELRKKTQLP